MSGADAELTGTTSSADPATTATRQRSEQAMAQRAAQAHGLNPDVFAQVIADSRSEARRRRRRLSDTRLDELVRDLGEAK